MADTARNDDGSPSAPSSTAKGHPEPTVPPQSPQSGASVNGNDAASTQNPSAAPAPELSEQQKRNLQLLSDARDRFSNRGIKILLVECNIVSQKIYKKLLAKVGLEIEIAEDGQECLDAFFAKEQGYYAAIMCKLSLPVKDGFTTVKELREWERQHNRAPVPMIAMCASSMGSMLKKCTDLGYQDMYGSPPRLPHLCEVLARQLPAEEELPDVSRGWVMVERPNTVGGDL